MADVFVSWSGPRRKQVATALTGWLRDVIQSLDIWMSEQDITPGARWNHELATQLNSTQFGILCLTPDNLNSGWLIFEAGALSKAIEESSVVPYRFGLKDTDVGPPLSQFQGVDTDREGTLKLVMKIHEATMSKLAKERVEKAFEKYWPDLEKQLVRISKNMPEKIRSERDILEELLELMRRAGSKELQTSLSKILDLKNVHSISVLKKLRSEGQKCSEVKLKIHVYEKKAVSEIPEEEIIPSSVYGITTDVAEIKK
ncbi:MAG: toll/interleukin-1 receptor domain-containing protein [Nitrosomonas sp.]|nr:MAG: toll/interleukin-1 receptor domain-containing protein [Nitrosomonas sp.]